MSILVWLVCGVLIVIWRLLFRLLVIVFCGMMLGLLGWLCIVGSICVLIVLRFTISLVFGLVIGVYIGC